jgi:hypothetical protein
MLADIYYTIQGIIQYELPKNARGDATVFDLPIKGWYYGDRSILSESPGIVFQGMSSPPRDAAFGTREITHTLTISCWARSDDNRLTEQQVLEFTRLIHEALLPHRRMWVLTKCPLCSLSSKGVLTKWSLSPEHFVLVHSGILGNFADVYSASGTNSYVARAKHEQEVIWQQTHLTGYSGFVNSGLATNAFYLLYDDILSGYSGSVSADALRVIQSYQNKKVRPIRLLYDVVYTDIKPVEAKNDNNLFRGGEFTISAKEIIKVSQFGPDNVPTTVWG